MPQTKERKFYKVVTPDLKSLGLRKNPNILQFTQNVPYVLPDDQVEAGAGDWGGIWVAAKKNGARTLTKYMAEKYGLNCRTFEVQIGDILYENSYRVKTNSVLLLAEVFFLLKLANSD